MIFEKYQMNVATNISIAPYQDEDAIRRDFQRDLWCVMGLPFDATTEQATYDHLLECIEKRQKCFLTTPNLNFVVAAQSDPEFRKTVIDSDWVIADGMPIIWAAKALGIPLTERVAGSSVFDRLRNEYRKHDRPLRVVFFGGPDGVAAEAFKKIAQDDSAMEVVGFYSPGFGTIEEMSPQHVIDQINESEPDIVLVALGAKRGQQWIDYNQQRLNTPVISHLGAVVNFVAGTVARAPEWMQKTGLEWLWRIWEERSLFRRYFTDGLAFLGLYFRNIRPYRKQLTTTSLRNRRDSDHSSISLKHDSDNHEMTLSGDFTYANLNELRCNLIGCVLRPANLKINCSEVKLCDSALLGLLLVAQKHLRRTGHKLELIDCSPKIRKLLELNGLNAHLEPQV